MHALRSAARRACSGGAAAGRRLLHEKRGGKVEPPGGSVPTSAFRPIQGVPESAGASTSLPQQYGVAGRYAAALYSAAEKAGKVDAVQTDLFALADAMRDSNDFRRLVEDPSIPRRDRTDALMAVLERMDVQDLTRNFVGLCAENNRLQELRAIMEKMQEIVASQRGEVAATVTTVEPLTDEQRDMVLNELSGVLAAGQTLVLEERIDPSIIGGVMISMGDKLVDMSVLSRVKQLQRIIREAV